MGYSLARQLAAALPPCETSGPVRVGLASKLSTQSDMESAWARHWCAELKIPLVYHRKLWEFAYVLQAIHESGSMRVGARGLGFGCGVEAISSYLASKGVSILATDLPAKHAAAKGWAATGQHITGLDKAFHLHLVDRALFDHLVRFREVDMNKVPEDLRDYDFCWSICALEHLGSIERGLQFIERSMGTLRPGGIAVHTTEFNLRQDGPTIDNKWTVLFQRPHIEALAERLQAQGHKVAPLDFHPGDGAMDRFVDLPPWSHRMPPDLGALLGPQYHLKLAIGGHIATCFGIVIRKGG